MLRDRVAALENQGVKDASVERARQLLAEAAGRVSRPHAYVAFEWHEPIDRTIADRVRVEILAALANLDTRK